MENYGGKSFDAFLECRYKGREGLFNHIFTIISDMKNGTSFLESLEDEPIAHILLVICYADQLFLPMTSHQKSSAYKINPVLGRYEM